MQAMMADYDGRNSNNYTLSWRGADGQNLTAQVLGLRLSESELGVSLRQEIQAGSLVHVETPDGSLDRDGLVRRCRRSGGSYVIDLQFQQLEEAAPQPEPEAPEDDHYEVLQVSETADAESIHRVFRLMAARFHPDNPETGDLEKFVRLTRAYEVLSHPSQRADYDSSRRARRSGPMKIFELKDFVVGVEAEENRRLGVLTLLYNQRRNDPDHPAVSLLDLERWMALPREYLNFTTWYLRSKQMVVMGDNCDFALTADGADFVERNAGRSQILSGLLLDGRTTIAERAVSREKWLRAAPPKVLPEPVGPPVPSATPCQ